jgi:phage terminase small subunit
VDAGMNYLSKDGELIYKALQEHCKQLKMMDADHYELKMLANSFALHAESAKLCNEDGTVMTITTEKGGTYSQVRPEYTVMKNEYQNILKHSAKFGLNPGDRDRLFKGLGKEKRKGFDLNK